MGDPEAIERQLGERESFRNRVFDVFSTNPVIRAVLRGLVSITPVVAFLGGPVVGVEVASAAIAANMIDSWLIGVYGVRGSRRVRRLLEGIEAKYAHLVAQHEDFSQTKVDRTFLASEEFADLSFQACDVSRRTRDEEKIRQYASLVLGAATIDRPQDLEAQSLLDALAELSPVEVRILAIIQRYGRIVPFRAGNIFVQELPQDLRADFAFHLSRIVRTGLLLQDAVGGPVGGASTMYAVTWTFGRLKALLAAGGYVINSDTGEQQPM